MHITETQISQTDMVVKCVIIYSSEFWGIFITTFGQLHILRPIITGFFFCERRTNAGWLLQICSMATGLACSSSECHGPVFFFFFWPHPWHGGGAQLSKPRPQKKYAALAMKFACWPQVFCSTSKFKSFNLYDTWPQLLQWSAFLWSFTWRWRLAWFLTWALVLHKLPRINFSFSATSNDFRS